LGNNAILVLEDGTTFHGTSIGATGSSIGEVVFNTAMTGYQEILTDPSYARQMVTLTYPHIGNTGTNSEDQESDNIWAAGLIIRDLPLEQSNWRNELSLTDYLKNNNIVAIADIDTRQLTRILRSKGSQSGCLIAGDQLSVDEALQKAKDFGGLKGMDLAQQVTTQQTCEWNESSWDFLETDIPIFGICLGHQLLALASGAKTIKMKFGHHGANHPVENLADKTVMITSQNHGFAVDEATLPESIQATHKSLFDGSLQGIEHTQKPAFSFQGHPEASPGPHDAAPLFERFIELMQIRKNNN